MKFIDAIYYADLDIIKEIVFHGSKVNQQVLLAAVDYGEIQVVDYFYSLGVELIQETVHLAAKNADLEMLNFLYSKGVNLNACIQFDNHGFLPIHTAAKSEKANINVFQYFLNNGIGINEKTKKGDTCLLLYVKSVSNFDLEQNDEFITKKQNIISFLLEKGANINDKNVDGKTALYYLLYDTDYKNAQYLIDNNADVNIQDYLNRNVLNQLCRESRGPLKKATELLISNNLDLSTIDRPLSHTTLEICKLNHKHKSVALIQQKLLENKKISKNKKREESIQNKILLKQMIKKNDLEKYINNIPLLVNDIKYNVINKKNFELVLRISTKKIIEYRDEQSMSLLLIAVGLAGKEEIVLSLLEAKANPNVLDDSGSGVLHHFSNDVRLNIELSIEILKSLSILHITSNHINKNLQTPLEKYLAKYNNPRIVYAFVYDLRSHVYQQDLDNNVFKHKSLLQVVPGKNR